MEFIFGTRLYDGKQCEYLKTEGESYTNFNDGEFETYVINAAAVTTTHRFRVLVKFKQEIDKQGKYCTWYYIDNHTIDNDRSAYYNAYLIDHAFQLKDQSEIIDDILIELLRRGY